jgi:hypothetical protein
MRLSALLIIVLFPAFAAAQTLTSIEEKTRGLKKYEGYLNYYWDDATGKIWLEVDKTGEEYCTTCRCRRR